MKWFPSSYPVFFCLFCPLFQIIQIICTVNYSCLQKKKKEGLLNLSVTWPIFTWPIFTRPMSTWPISTWPISPRPISTWPIYQTYLYLTYLYLTYLFSQISDQIIFINKRSSNILINSTAFAPELIFLFLCILDV